jgi:hypothetical protein
VKRQRVIRANASANKMFLRLITYCVKMYGTGHLPTSIAFSAILSLDLQ